jgi:6-phosphogluconate dehydrogenase
MDEPKYDIGMVGLGVMGRNLLLNMADHGFSVVGYDKDESKVQALKDEGKGKKILGEKRLPDFVQSLTKPKVIMMLVPAGAPVDSVIADLMPHLEPGDLIIDGGNSFYKDTDRRFSELDKKKIMYLGMGVSGGESGARHGPSMMPGGHRDAYDRVKSIFESAAAKVNGDPCVTYLGRRSAGHYVKMVHNGIEYGVMQLIAETYDLMKRGLGASNDELHDIYRKWNQGELSSYLIEITAKIFQQTDDRTDNRLVDMILDAARQKGTGGWTSEDAMALQVPIPTIDMAVAMRNLSDRKDIRRKLQQALRSPARKFDGDRKTFITQLRNALYAAMVLTYAQGMALLSKASEAYHYDLNLEDVARIWRGGCIIRAALLEKIRSAYKTAPELPLLLMDRSLGEEVLKRITDLRSAAHTAIELGIPAPGLMVSLAYFDAFQSAHLPANLIQAQRDYFGAHTYERIDAEGVFHTQWEQDK